MTGDIPFPSVENTEPELLHKLADSGEPTTAEISKNNASASASANANPIPNLAAPNHYIRPRTSAIVRPSMTNTKRAFRRSLDAAMSLPGFGTTSYEHDPERALNHHHNHTHQRGFSSFEEERTMNLNIAENSSSGMRSVGQAFQDMHSSNSFSPPQAMPTRGVPLPSAHPDQRAHTSRASRSPSQSQSQSPSRRRRATSPLRLLHTLSSGLSHMGGRAAVVDAEEPFVPINPFKFNSSFPFCCFPSQLDGEDEQHEHEHEHKHAHNRAHTHSHVDLEQAPGLRTPSSGACDCEDIIPTFPTTRTNLRSFIADIRLFAADSRTFVTDTLPRELYLNLLLRLPAMYFSRVCRIFQDAEVSKPDIRRMADAWDKRARVGGVRALGAGTGHVEAGPHTHIPSVPDEWTPASVSPALLRFKHSWEVFIDSLIREWKTLNVVSALLASAILTMFQVPDAADDPVTRTCALLSLICALMSLSYGCMYIVRFGQMRSMFHASRWAEDARKTKTSIWWNVWVLLATPAVWLAWAMICFLSAILSFVWRTGSSNDPTDRTPLSPRTALVIRILITAVLVLGLLYLAMIVRTLKKYGSRQDSSRALLKLGRKDVELGLSASVAGPARTLDVDVRLGGGKEEERGMHMVVGERRGRERERVGPVLPGLSDSRDLKSEQGGSGLESRTNERRGSSSGRRGHGGLLGLFGLGGASEVVSREGETGFEVELDVKLPAEVEVVSHVVSK